MKRYYGLTEPYERKPRIKRPRPKPAPRVLGSHGLSTILEVRDERGRKALRYSREAI